MKNYLLFAMLFAVSCAQVDSNDEFEGGDEAAADGDVTLTPGQSHTKYSSSTSGVSSKTVTVTYVSANVKSTNVATCSEATGAVEHTPILTTNGGRTAVTVTRPAYWCKIKTTNTGTSPITIR